MTTANETVEMRKKGMVSTTEEPINGSVTVTLKNGGFQMWVRYGSHDVHLVFFSDETRITNFDPERKPVVLMCSRGTKVQVRKLGSK